MKIMTTVLSGVLEIRPTIHEDNRGSFAENYRQDLLEDAVGHPVSWAQGNTSFSKARTIRGLHYSLAPKGQAKYVTCTSGMIWDVVVDIRPGSSTFGQYVAVTLNSGECNALYIPSGYAHGFVAMASSHVSYMVSTPYSPEHEFAITPFDPDLSLNWVGVLDPLLSEKDRTAPTLAQARKSGDLPVYSVAHTES
jgi:dTDP-4-dehydrorhamnose 3,5-epimerase